MKLVGCGAILLLLCAAVFAQSRNGRPRNDTPAAIRQDRLPQNTASDRREKSVTNAAEKIAFLHQKMGTPRPGEWLAEHHEDGQTFEQYLKVRPASLGTDRKTIYIAPLGRHTAEQAQVMRDTGEFLSIFYGMKIRWLDPIPENVIPASARRVNKSTQATQFDSVHIIQQVLPKRVPRDAAALLALTATDLWPGNDWNYVFGQGSLGFPTGVWSMNRLGNAADEAEQKLLLYRMVKIASHETGHLFGIPHCTAYACGMNGSNSLAETDRHRLAFCPECEAKIWLVSGSDSIKRYRDLAAFAQRHGFAEEEKLWRESAAALDLNLASQKSDPSLLRAGSRAHFQIL